MEDIPSFYLSSLYPGAPQGTIERKYFFVLPRGHPKAHGFQNLRGPVDENDPERCPHAEEPFGRRSREGFSRLRGFFLWMPTSPLRRRSGLKGRKPCWGCKGQQKKIYDCFFLFFKLFMSVFLGTRGLTQSHMVCPPKSLPLGFSLQRPSVVSSRFPLV